MLIEGFTGIPERTGLRLHNRQRWYDLNRRQWGDSGDLKFAATKCLTYALGSGSNDALLIH